MRPEFPSQKLGSDKKNKKTEIHHFPLYSFLVPVPLFVSFTHFSLYLSLSLSSVLIFIGYRFLNKVSSPFPSPPFSVSREISLLHVEWRRGPLSPPSFPPGRGGGEQGGSHCFFAECVSVCLSVCLEILPRTFITHEPRTLPYYVYVCNWVIMEHSMPEDGTTSSKRERERENCMYVCMRVCTMYGVKQLHDTNIPTVIT